MNKNIIKIALGVMFGSALGLTSCIKEIDESNLYTFTGQTIEDYLEANDSLFSDFNVIMERSGYNRQMSSYGQYTCYAPVNSGVRKYIDSLYNDTTDYVENAAGEKTFLHHGMTENSLDGLTDSLCKDIAQYHISAMLNSYIDQLSNVNGASIATILNTPFISKLDNDGVVRFNDVAEVLEFDKEMTNGYVHVISDVIPRTTQKVDKVFNRHKEFSIFYDALRLTGLADTLNGPVKKEATYSLDNISGRPGSGMSSGRYFVPKECKISYTVFAETNETLARYGIHDFASLKAKCIEWYANAKEWYDYPGKDEYEISTGDDYTYKYNVVNMFMRYHIIKAGMTKSKLTYVRNMANQDWNYAFGGEPFDYYETMLPHALMKIWQPLYQNTGAQTNIWINRYRQNNTLTDEIGTMGKDETHQIIKQGVMISNKAADIQAYNGYIHTIEDVLVYDADVPNHVLHERMRIDSGSMLYELISNNIRYATPAEIGARNLSSNDGTMVRLPLNYFDNLVSYNQKTKLAWYCTGAWRAWQADQISGWDEYDFALRLPAVPTGDYEIRVIYPPMANGGLMQYYLGTSSDPSSMQPLGIPFDARYPNSTIQADRDATGYMLSSEFSDYGVASDLVMRNHGYMRAPASFARGNGDGKGRSNPIYTRVTDPSTMLTSLINCCRYEEGYGTSMMRKILGTVHIDQSKEYWLRIKNLLTGYDQLGFSFDFLELVPVDIVNSQDYTEDWY